MNSPYFAYRQVLIAQANELVARYTSGRPPYDPYSIADALQVRVQERSLNGLEGYVQLEGNRWSVVISSSGPRTRRRFTLAHELGHVLLFRAGEEGCARDLMRYRSGDFQPDLHQDPDEEALCNAFAQELLMPRSDVEERLQLKTVSPRSILDFAREFDVSIQAAALKSITVLGKRRVGCSFWDLQALWPVKLWWTGVRTRLHAELQRLQELALASSEKIEIWASYNRRQAQTKVQVAPVSTFRYSLILTVSRGVGRYGDRRVW
jgi:Zn-dependent peptidase ImmA (M78 family)